VGISLVDHHARVGDRAPNGLLFGPQGESLWLHDLFGFAFVALTFDDVRNHPTIEPLPQSPYLRHYLVSWFDAPANSGLRDRTFYDPGDRLRKRFGAKRGTTYLVRPDDHIAAIEAAGGRRARQIYEAVVGQPLERSSAQAYPEQEPAVAFAQSP
jgi:3-(3-hydroxy-phenyl)propionate hydroxylase